MFARIAMFATCLMLLCALAVAPAPAADVDRAQLREEIRKILKENPGLLLEALAKDKAALFDLVAQGNKIKRQQVFEKNVRQALANPLKPSMDLDRPLVGDPGAPVTIVEYSDFLCSACATASRNVKSLVDKYPRKVRVLLKHKPGDDLARTISLYFEALARQDPALAWRFSRQVFERQKKIKKHGLAAVTELAKELGADQNELGRDLADPVLDKRISADMAEADEFGLDSTPSFVVNGVNVTGAAPVYVFEDIIRLWEEHQKAAGKRF